MIRRIIIIVSVLCVHLGCAQAQGKPEVFPQLTQSASSIAFSPDGALLAASGEGIVNLWDVASGRELRTLRGHSGTVTSVAFSPDGHILASGSEDRTIKLWDVASGRELRTVKVAIKVHSLTFSPDGHTLAFGGESDSDKPYAIVFLDVASGSELRKFGGTAVRSSIIVDKVKFSPDGRVLASGDWNKTINLWDVASGALLRSLYDSADIFAIAFSPDGRLLASASGDDPSGSVSLWDVTSGRLTRRFPTKGNHVAFSPDGRLLASDSKNTITLWDPASGRALRTLTVQAPEVADIAFSPDGRTLASGTGGCENGICGGPFQKIELLDVASGRIQRSLTGTVAWVKSVAFSPAGRLLASLGGDYTIKIWDAAGGRKLRTLSGVEGGLAFSPDGRLLASASDSRTGDKSIELLDVANGTVAAVLRGNSDYISTVAFSPSGRVLASYGLDEKIRLWDVASRRVLRTLAGDYATFRQLAFSPDGKMIAANGPNDTIKVWDVASGQLQRTFKNPAVHYVSPDVTALAFSPDGHTLASGDLNNTITLWDAARGSETRVLGERTDYDYTMNSVAFAPDGRTLASASTDGTIKLWNTETGQVLRVVSAYSGYVYSVAFSPDGKWLASGNGDGTIKIWDVSSGSAKDTFVDFTDGSSIAITPEGYYDASSAAAEDHLNVRVGDRVFPIAAYRDKFYRPDLVKLSLAGDSLKQFGFAGIDAVKVAPIVEISGVPASATTDKLAVNLRITDGGGGIGLVRLFVNGTAVVQDDQPHPAPAVAGGTVTRAYTVQLAGGNNALRAVAFNADDSMQSNPAVASVTLQVAPHATLHAVVVGIQEFKNPNLKLGYSVADAQLFADTLQKYAAPLFNGKPDIKLLTTPAETTRDGIIGALKAMASTVGADDLFIFYVASHGLADDGEYYLVTSNVGSLSTERLKTDAITKEELTGLVGNIAATKKLMVIDTCQAEALGNALQVSLLTRGLDEATALKILSRAMGTTVLAASTSTQEALEGYQGHGLFTYVVAAGLSGSGDIDKNGFVTTLGLAHYVDDKVPDLAEQQFKRAQYPTVETNGQEFPLAKVR